MRIVPSKMASKFYQNFIKILMKFHQNFVAILEGTILMSVFLTFDSKYVEKFVAAIILHHQVIVLSYFNYCAIT